MQLYHDGLERSGNVYFSHCLGMTLKVELKSVRTHNVLTLKEYKEPYPFIISLRDALPSITSSKVFRDYFMQNNLVTNTEKATSDPDVIIQRYQEYTDYLLANEQFFIAPFHEFTKDHNAVIDKIIKVYPELEIRTRVSTFEDIFKHANHEGALVLHPHMGNFPREDVKEKEEVKQMFLEKYSKEIAGIQETIDKLYLRYDSI